MTQTPAEAMAPTLMRRTLRSRWRTIVLVAAAVTLLSTAYTVSKGPTYTSTAEVLVDALPGNAFSPSSLTSAQQVTVGLVTEANLLDSSAVATLADVPGSGSVSASVVLNSQMIQISYSSSSRAAAQRGAQAYAEAFLSYREAVAVSVRNNDIADLQDQIDAANKTLADVDEELSRPNPATGAAAKAQLITLQVADLQQSLADARAQPTHPGSVVVPASVPSKTQVVRSAFQVVVGLILGLMAGLVIAAWRTWTDDRLDSRFVTFVGGKPIWATLHSLRYRHGDMPAYVERVAEEYRQLRAAVLTNAPAPRVVLLAASGEGEDISEVSVNLADSVASAGFQVTVVDASPEPMLSRLLGFQDAPGLSDVLRGDCRLEDALDVSELLWLMPAGRNPSVAEDLTAGRRFAELVGEMRDGADYVFLVGPPVDSSVGLAAAAIADTVLVVGVDGRTTGEELERQLGHLATHQLQIDGIVLTAPVPKHRPGPTADAVVDNADSDSDIDPDKGAGTGRGKDARKKAGKSGDDRARTSAPDTVEGADGKPAKKGKGRRPVADDARSESQDTPDADVAARDAGLVEVGDSHRTLRLASRPDVGKSA